MKINNANFGTVNTGAGNVHIGDKINILDGITILSKEYKDQIQDIQNLLCDFKPVTALSLISTVKKRIEESEIYDKKKVLSKILFLEGLCKNELNEYQREDISRIFIQAYRLNPQDKDLRKRACIEYRFLGEISNALSLSDKILELEEYDITAWYVKTTVSEDIGSYLKSVPRLVLNNKSFQYSTIYYIISALPLQLLEDLKSYNLELTFNADDFKELTFKNKGFWSVGIDLLFNKVFNNISARYIIGNEELSLKETPDVSLLIHLLQGFVSSFINTEISGSISHQKFLYYYLDYLVIKNESNLINLELSYKEIRKRDWFYLSCLCQVLNHLGKHEDSLSYLEEYEINEVNISREFFIFKASILCFLNKNDDVYECFIAYLDATPIIDEMHGLNLLSTFFKILKLSELTDDKFQGLFDKLFNKDFKNDVIKEIIFIASTLWYLDNPNINDLHERLEKLKYNNTIDLDQNYKDLIAKCLDEMFYTKEAIDYMNTYLDKSLTSPSLKVYILLLNNHIHSKEDKNSANVHEELLNLLEFWRNNCDYSDIELLKIEHDLHYEINNWEVVNSIEQIFYYSNPNKEENLFRYLLSLDRLKRTEEINRIVENVNGFFDDQELGLTVSHILIKNNHLEKGYEILYNLASKKSNSKARARFFYESTKFTHFLKKYEKVELGAWVTYQLGDDIEKVKIDENSRLNRSFLGRPVGDEFQLNGGINNREFTVKIVEITNDDLNLFREITKEAHNPLNNMGIHSFAIKEDENILDVLKDNFGEQGNEIETSNQEYLNKYVNLEIGFSEVTRVVFKEKYIDAYFSLTQSNDYNFITLPLCITNNVELSPDISFALDFSSLPLFYLLQEKRQFKFKHKFLVSYYVKLFVEQELDEIRHSPYSPLSVHISSNDVQKIIDTQDYKENRIQFLESILEWIKQNCVVDNVKEKLDLAFKFNFDASNNKFMKLLIDNMYLSNRQKTHLISSDVTIYMLAKGNKSLFCNMISPEKYLKSIYPEKADNNFYNFLLQSNYIGITINNEELKTELYKLLAGDTNYFNLCLENLKYYNNPDQEVITNISFFLKEFYLEPSIRLEEKNQYAEIIIYSVIQGMSNQLIDHFYKNIWKEFELLGEYQVIIKDVFVSALRSR